MTLKEVRESKGLTQKAAAGFVGMPLRTYQRYEKEISYSYTIKYRYICQRLEKYGYIDEEHGVLSLEQIEKACVQVCAEYSLQYCYLFGSYAKGCASCRSDVDLAVSLDDSGIFMGGLEESFRESLRKRADLLYPDQLYASPEIVRDILQNGILLYRNGRSRGGMA